ncbi:DMT family transporter [Vibrio quintilis]|uniref:Putative inner membrane transporter YhbE n=1 Tax=Vibrio quintilis TaxID=1117707 RepID=A0A1M7YWN3_9VIBR|nr:DMT family transporter [Vibrio quintilis]SHO57067.1 putative inner membrane transporter YhbE [Vibrio quintilis]
MLAIALKLTADFTDPVTLTWFRFMVAGIIVFTLQKRRNKLVQFKPLTKKEWLRLALAATFLIINYTCYAWSLVYLTPEASQLCMQVSPLFLSLGGLIFFKEYISRMQWFCFACLFAGLVIFFHPVIEGGAGQETATLITGMLIILASSLSWCCYALVQKSLFSRLDSSNILLFIYLFAMVVMLPFSSPSGLTQLSAEDMLIVLFCCLNTIIAYGSFAQALRYWETVQVSSVIAMTPVVTFIMIGLCVVMDWWPDVIHAASADWLSLAGMAIVVLSAISIQVLSKVNQDRRRKAVVMEAEEVTEPSAA